MMIIGSMHEIFDLIGLAASTISTQSSPPMIWACPKGDLNIAQVQYSDLCVN